MQLSVEHKRLAANYKEIHAEGLTLYPITVEEYEAFSIARAAIEAMQQSFEVKYVSMPLLAAYYAMDYDAYLAGQTPCGLFSQALLFLALALRLGRGEDMSRRIRAFQLVCADGDMTRLRAVRFEQGGEEKEITPVTFSRLRPVLAAQNGIELISETANPELVEAERDIAAAKSMNLKPDFYDLRATVAALTRQDEEEINGWPILKLVRQQRAIQRALDYVVHGINAGAGCSWKGGNPTPSPFFDRERSDSPALMRLSDFAGGAGERAVEQQQTSGEGEAEVPAQLKILTRSEHS